MSRLRPLRPLLLACLLLLTAALVAVPASARESGGPSAYAAKKKHHRSRAKARVYKRCGKPHRRRGWSRRDLDGDHRPNRKDRDIDGDHRPNKRDCDIDGDGKLNGRDRDTDGDRIKNKRDRDVDSDRIKNNRDRNIDQDKLRNCKPGRLHDKVRDRDMDGDGIPNQRDRDMDGDGLRNDVDNDTDDDGISNRKDPDIDCDSIPNYEDDDSDASGSSFGDTVPHAHLPHSFFGMVADAVQSSSGGARRSVLDQIAGTGVRLLRQRFNWNWIETSPGVYNFGYYDRYMADVVSKGFSVLPVLFDPPPWRATGISDGHFHYPPRSGTEFGAFAARLVRRYGPNGGFWHAHPGLPYRPLRAWQIWNEPHIRQYWPAGPNPAAYVAMARPVAAAIHAADPGAQVIAAALSQSNLGMPMDSYLRGEYAAGAAPVFDALAIHPYAGAADQVFDIMDRIRRIANANGDASAGLWMTELGWATSGPASPYNLGEAAQAILIRRVWSALVQERAQLGLRGMIYFNWRDQSPYAPSFNDFFGLHTGLLAIDGRHKPAYQSFASTLWTMTH
jgi:hypothetical protein